MGVEASGWPVDASGSSVNVEVAKLDFDRLAVAKRALAMASSEWLESLGMPLNSLFANSTSTKVLEAKARS